MVDHNIGLTVECLRMKRLKIYVDTSVVGGTFDPEFAEHSRALLDAARSRRVLLVISELMLPELLQAPENVVRELDALPDDSIQRVSISDDAIDLAEAYISAQVVARSARNDALHVALATISHADVVVSWNFKHLVNIERIRGFNYVNRLRGFQDIDIRSPREVIVL